MPVRMARARWEIRRSAMASRIQPPKSPSVMRLGRNKSSTSRYPHHVNRSLGSGRGQSSRGSESLWMAEQRNRSEIRGRLGHANDLTDPTLQTTLQSRRCKPPVIHPAKQPVGRNVEVVQQRPRAKPIGCSKPHIASDGLVVGQHDSLNLEGDPLPLWTHSASMAATTARLLTQILFVGRASEEAHKEIWIVEADGSSPHRFEMTPACGGSFSDESSAGCYSPEWSPDGSMIVFTRSSSDGEALNRPPRSRLP